MVTVTIAKKWKQFSLFADAWVRKVNYINTMDYVDESKTLPIDEGKSLTFETTWKKLRSQK